VCGCGELTTHRSRRCVDCRTRRAGEAQLRARLYASAAWRRTKQLVWARDNWTCVRCGHVDVGNRRRTLDCHHKRHVLELLAEGLAFDPAECETLCDRCHGAVR
jgi:hypothetical protein